MASLLNNASLLLNPAGSVIAYEEDKIFSVLPRNGDGDFTFTGGDGGTRVNQYGYIEQVPRNLITDSADFTTWTKDASLTRTDNQPDPFGTNTAAKFSNNLPGGDPTNAYIYKNVSYIAGETYTFSLYIKGDSAGSISMRYNDSTTGPEYGVNYTTEWQRFDVTRTVNSTSGIFVLGGYGYWTPGENITVAFAQHEMYPTSRPYQPTTDRLNYPRITYQNGVGGWLCEGQRTNLITYSQQFDNGAWSKPSSTVTANSTISPDGTNNAYKLTSNNGVVSNGVYQGFTSATVTSPVTYVTQTVFVKKGEWKYAILLFSNIGVDSAAFDLDNGTISNQSSADATVKQFKDGWWRISVTRATNGGTLYCQILPSNTPTYGSVGDGTSGIYIWGAQIENNVNTSTTISYTSYIPTTSATVTRPKDYMTVGGINTSGIISGNSNWTLYVQNDANTTATNAFGWRLFSNLGYVGMYQNTVAIFDDGGGTQVAALNGNAGLGLQHKVAISYDGTNLKYFLDGILQYTDTSYSTPSSWTYMGTDAIDVSRQYKNYAIFNQLLTDAQCQELTTVNSGSGGNISYYGPYTIHTFTGSATFTPSFNGEVEVLVVAGGGAGGGGDVGGGGGAGGLLYVSSYGVSSGTGITVTIGAGGAGVQNASLAGGNGSNSVFGGLTAIGGGGGAGWTKGTGNDGGSGGGSTYYGVGGSGIPGQGNNGGTGGIAAPPYPQCGGGGAGEAGFPNQSSTVAGNGGDGLPYSISGFSTYYAGGGGGATEGSPSVPGTPGTGGLGGGGNGGSQGASILGTPGVNGLGGGGGGCDPQAGATGGSGIVIVRYLT